MKKLFVLLLIIYANQLNAASFDCSKASSLSEIMICNDSKLSEMDSELGIIYKRAKKTVRNKKMFKKQSYATWKWREKNCHTKECLLSWYEQRKITLEKIINDNNAKITSTDSFQKEIPSDKGSEQEKFINTLLSAPIENLFVVEKNYRKNNNEESKDALLIVQKTIALRYESGYNIEKDLKKAFNWHLKAAKGGDPSSMFYVAEAYKLGTDIKKDIAKSNRWYLQAINKHHPKATITYGLFQIFGKNGVKKDIEAGFNKINDQAKLGNEEAKKVLIGLKALTE